MAKKKENSEIKKNDRSPKPAFAEFANPAKEAANKREREAAQNLFSACQVDAKEITEDQLKAVNAAYADYIRTQRGKLADEPRIAWRGFKRSVQAGEKTKAMNHLKSFAGLLSIKHRLTQTEVTTTESTTTESKTSEPKK